MKIKNTDSIQVKQTGNTKKILFFEILINYKHYKYLFNIKDVNKEIKKIKLQAI